MTPTDRILSALKDHGCDPQQRGNGWSARCPAHDDRSPSLSIAEGDDGRTLVKCHAGCKVEAICAAVDLSVVDLMPTANTLPTPNKSNANGKQASSKPRIDVTYDYHDEAGDVLFQVVRFEPKGFKQRCQKPDGTWVWSVKGVRVVPYRLPELLADPTRIVFIVEGEKDVDNLARIGVLATCNAGGAGKWTSEHAEFLRNRQVVILPDNDDAGRKHAQQVAHSLHGIAKWVRVVTLPNLPSKGDASDWIAAGGTKDELKRLTEATPDWTPAAETELMRQPRREKSRTEAASKRTPVMTCLADVEPQEIKWLWPDRIPLGRITLLVGRPGEGKSFVTIDMASRISTGAPWPDGTSCPRGSVLMICAEDDPGDTIRPRLDAHRADANKVHLLSAVRMPDTEQSHERMVTLADVDAISEALSQLDDCRLVIVDPIGSFLGGGTDAHRDNEVRAVLAPIAQLAEQYGAAVLVVAHRRKSAGSVADDLALGSRAFTGIARAVWHLSRDPEVTSRRLLLPGKNNLAREDHGMAFTIAGEPPRIVWEREPIKMHADDALAIENARKKPGPEAQMQSQAERWLRAAMKDGRRFVKELEDEWVNGQGGSKSTLKRAKEAIGAESGRDKVPGPWWWQLSKSCDKGTSSSTQQEELGHLGPLEENTEILDVFDDIEPKKTKFLDHGSLGEICPPAKDGDEPDDEWGEL